MNTNVLIKTILETLKEEKEKELKDKVSVVTKIFNNFKEEKDDNYNGFKEFINGKDCLCYIKGYAEFINDLSNDEIKQVINNTDLTEHELRTFVHILINKVIDVKNDIINIINELQIKFVNQINDKIEENIDFESMSKEELIDYIKKNK